MKIVLFMDSPLIATGYASTCRLTAKELTKRGYDVYAVGFNSYSQPDSIMDWYGIKVIPNSALKRDKDAIYGDVEFVNEVVRDINPDILFFHNDSYRHSYLKTMPKDIMDKVVFWLPFEGIQPDIAGLEIFSRCAATRFVTQHAIDMHRESLRGKDIGNIYHAIDTESYTPGQNKKTAKASKKLGIENKFVVVRVDRHQPRKHWRLTLEAFAKFAKDKDDVFLLGKCNPRDCVMWKEDKKEGVDLEAVAKELGIEKKVFFDDFFFSSRAMAECFYHPADAFLTTTSGEGFGLPLCEAMACGLPIICPDTPVLPEVLGAGGIYCKLKGREYNNAMNVWQNVVDVDDVAAKLQGAYDDWLTKGGAQLSEIGSKGRVLALERYTPKTVYDQWDTVFKSVAERKEMVSVVTVLYNVSGESQLLGEDGIDKLRESIEKHVKHPYEWIIVDNGSPEREATRKWIEDAAKNNARIKPVLLDVNKGFAGGCNSGIARAIGKWVALVNPDSEALDPQKLNLPTDFLRMMVEKAKSDKEIGIVGMTLNRRDDILTGSIFPYFCNVLISRECLDACMISEGKWLEEEFWPAYYEDLSFVLRAAGKGFKAVEHNVPFWHKSGGTNKHAIDGGKDGPVVTHLKTAMDNLEKTNPAMADFPRKRGELATSGMQGLIGGNIALLNKKWGPEARSKIKVVWDTHIGAGVGFSQIAEGLVPELHKLGFDVYVNDWSNGANVEDPLIRELISKTRVAHEKGEDLDNAIHIVCWLMESYLDIDASYKVGVSFCESTKVRPQYLNSCNSMDRILTFSEFCRGVQRDSGFKTPIHVLSPAVHPIFANYYERPVKDKFTFLAVGVSQERKDTRRLVDAFCEAFPKDLDYPPECEPGFPFKPSQVELVIKSNNFGELDWIERDGFSKRANVRAIFTGWDKRATRKDFTMQEMYDLYTSADCLVHPSHGEGIGMPILEAAATGLPVIFTNWSSPAEYFNDSNSYPISLSSYPGTTFTEAYPGHGIRGENGVWANCFALGSPVRTVDGISNIEDIKIGDLVLTHKGRYRKVTNISARKYSGNVVVINGMHNNHKIIATPEHPFMCVKTEQCWKKRRGHVTCKPNCSMGCSDKLWDNYKKEFINASELNKRDALMLPFISDEKEQDAIDLADFAGTTAKYDDNFIWIPRASFSNRMNKRRVSIKKVAEYAHVSNSVAQRVLSCGGLQVAPEKLSLVTTAAEVLRYEQSNGFKKLNRFIEVNEKFGRLCGFYLAEGCSSGSKVTFSFHAMEKEYVAEVKKLMMEIFGIECGSVDKNGENGINVSFFSAILVRMFRGLFGSGAHSKKMPSSWAFLSKNVAKEIIYGLWHGDGCAEKQRFSYKTSSVNLAYQMHALCLKIGIAGGIIKNKIGQYIVCIGEETNTKIASSILGCEDISRKRPHFKTWRDNDYVYLPIHDIKKKRYSGMVFNLEVEEDNTYCVANAVVHNCHIGHLKHLMRHVIRNPQEAKDKGKRASELVRTKYNWNECARKLMPLLFEWDEERKKKPEASSFDPLTFQRPNLEPVKQGDRVLVDIVSRDRHSYLCSLLVSLLGQTFKDWDVIIQCDDSDESMPNDYQIRSLMDRCSNEGHGWRIIRSHRQGPHIAHDRSLQMAKDDPHRKYKLVCRIDDDIYVRPDYLEKLFNTFLSDKNADLAAVAGVYLDPKRAEREQEAPKGFEADLNYAGKIDHNVMWPYVCPYPKGTGLRFVEHLYSSFMFRVEAACVIGGYCRKFSQIGHREESDFTYRFYLGGWKQCINPEAIGFHFTAPSGGIRSDNIGPNRMQLAQGDEQIYNSRLKRWKKRAELRKQRDAESQQAFPLAKDAPSRGRIVIAINGGKSLEAIEAAIERFGAYSDELYVACEDEGFKEKLAKNEKVKMVATSDDEVALLTKAILADGDHEFVMTVTDTMSFSGDPIALIDERYDDYVFEVYRTYVPGRIIKGSDTSSYVADESTGTVIGPETRNQCLLTRRRRDAKPVMERIMYADMMVLENDRILPLEGKSLMGNDLIRLSDLETKQWRKVCTYQYPEGRLNPPRYADMEPDAKVLVSIIIPTAGRLPLLKKCIDSIYAHTTTPFEIVIVDNGSTDGTAEYIDATAKVRPNIRHVRQGSNLGYQKAVNIGVLTSRGEYILLFNDDAWVEGREPDGRDWLEVYVDELKKDQNIGIVGPHGGESPALGDRILYFWCVMIRRSTWDKIGQLDDATFKNYGGDDDWCRRLRDEGYSIKERITKLRHLMTCVPEHVKKPELEESILKLRAKYSVVDASSPKGPDS